METLQSTQLFIPLYQMVLLLSISTIVLFFGKLKLALITNYLFTMYWGYGMNRELLIGARIEHFNTFTFMYFGFGLLIAVLALLSFFAHPGR